MPLQEQAEIVQCRVENDVDEDATPGQMNADRKAVREVPSLSPLAVADCSFTVGGRVSSELSVQRALAAVPIDQRAMRVLWSGAPAGGYKAVDPPATRALAQLAPGPAVRTVLYRGDVCLGGGIIA